jgi:hypothetical protein
MCLTQGSHLESHSQNQNLQRRACQPIPYTQGGNLPVQPMPRGALNTEASVTRTASSEQTSSSNLFRPNTELSYADVSASRYLDVDEKSAYTHQFHTCVDNRHTDFNNEAYRYGNDHWPMQPEMDDHAFQMEIEPSKPGAFRGDHWLEPAEELQNDVPLAPYMENANVNANEALDALDFQGRDNPYSGSVRESNQSQEYHGPPFPSWSQDSSHRHAPSQLALLSEQGAVPAVVPWNPSSSLHPSTILALYPNAGYDPVLDMNAVAANAQITGLSAELGDTFGSQPAPMLNYHRSSSISVFPPLAEQTLHIPNGVDQLAVCEASSDISLESHQSVWDATTGESVTMKTRRSLSNAERAHSQTIRNLGGQCDKCRRSKRKVCVSLLIDCPVSDQGLTVRDRPS